MQYAHQPHQAATPWSPQGLPTPQAYPAPPMPQYPPQYAPQYAPPVQGQPQYAPPQQGQPPHPAPSPISQMLEQYPQQRQQQQPWSPPPGFLQQHPPQPPPQPPPQQQSPAPAPEPEPAPRVYEGELKVNFIGLARIARPGPAFRLEIPTRGLALARDLARPCAVFVSQELRERMASVELASQVTATARTAPPRRAALGRYGLW
jgi:hypothetical protein